MSEGPGIWHDRWPKRLYVRELLHKATSVPGEAPGPEPAGGPRPELSEA